MINTLYKGQVTLKNNKTKESKKDGLFMVKFNVFKGLETENKKKPIASLVYKYLNYNPIFTKSLVHYIEEAHKTDIKVMNENPTLYFIDKSFHKYSR